MHIISMQPYSAVAAPTETLRLLFFCAEKLWDRERPRQIVRHKRDDDDVSSFRPVEQRLFCPFRIFEEEEASSLNPGLLIFPSLSLLLRQSLTDYMLCMGEPVPPPSPLQLCTARDLSELRSTGARTKKSMGQRLLCPPGRERNDKDQRRSRMIEVKTDRLTEKEVRRRKKRA